MPVICKRCDGDIHRKDGVVRGHQRYYCKSCGYHFTDTPPRGKPEAMKALAVLLYAMGNANFSMIGRLLGVSDVTVMRWVRHKAESLPEPAISGKAVILSLDEMWHFLKKNSRSSGYGGPMMLWSGEPWPGFWVNVITPPVKSSSRK